MIWYGFHHSGENIFRATLSSGRHSMRLYAARNGYVSAQVALRSDRDFAIRDVCLDLDASIRDHVRWEYFYVGYTPFAPRAEGRFTNILPYPADGLFPDGLEPPAGACPVAAGQSQAVWLRLYAGKDTPAGAYSIGCTVITDGGSLFLEIGLRVIAMALPEARDSSLSVSCWSWNAGRLMEADGDDQITRQYGCLRYSQDWWRVMENYALSWRQHRANDVLIYPQVLLCDGGSVAGADHFHFRWERFGQVAGFFRDKGNAKSITGSRLLFTRGTVTGEDGYMAYILERDAQGVTRRVLRPMEGPGVERWWREYLPALQSHLEETGLLACYRQQIGDEPHTPQQISQWKAVREKLRRYAPKIRIGDAFNTQNGLEALREDVDLWVPRLDVLEANADFYRRRQRAGQSVWMYVCDYPGQNSLNRNVDQNAWMGRSLFWLAARLGVTGFLHWAWNMWQVPADALGCRGQGYIVLPDPGRLSVLSTIRYENLLEGAQDFELLLALGKRDPEGCGRLMNRVARGRDDYETQMESLWQAFDGLYEVADREEDP